MSYYFQKRWNLAAHNSWSGLYDRGQKDKGLVRGFALHTVYLGSIPSTWYGSLSFPGVILGRGRHKSWTLPDVVPKYNTWHLSHSRGTSGEKPEWYQGLLCQWTWYPFASLVSKVFITWARKTNVFSVPLQLSLLSETIWWARILSQCGTKAVLRHVEMPQKLPNTQLVCASLSAHVSWQAWSDN